MESLTIILDLTNQGFREGEYGVTEHKGEMVIGGMPQGTEDANPTVMIGLEQPGGNGYLVAETTLALLLTAAEALKARHGDPRTSRT